MLKCLMMEVSIAQAQYEEESDIEEDDTDDNDSDQESNYDDGDDNVQQHRNGTNFTIISTINMNISNNYE